MVRLIAAIVGLFFSGWLLVSAVLGGTAYISEPPAATAESLFHKHPKEVEFSFEGPLGKYDRAQLQRGFQVYKEVCSACHGLAQVAFRDLQQIGYSEGAVKKIAADWPNQIASIDPATGEAATRKALPTDKIAGPYPNDVAARAANNNALPPDLSLIAKARHEGPAYLYSLLSGYEAQPAELLKQFPEAKTPNGLHYNPYFATLNLAMPQPLTSDGQVTYADGNPKPTVDQMSKDVAAFLTWAAEPKLENRHRTGLGVLIFLLMATGLAFMSYKSIWADKKH
jgi:ubiquinol-cytochrome c reductase cytochrome c1 subunit